MEKDEVYLDRFTSLGSTLTGELPTFQEFVCELYGHKDTCDVNGVRFLIFKGGKFSEESLPPTEDSLSLHVKRANYQAYIWRNATTAMLNLPSATDNGWQLNGGYLAITWMSIPIAPDSLLSFINCGCKLGCNTNRCNCKKASLKCTDLCKCEGCRNPFNVENEEEDYNAQMCDGLTDSDSENEDEQSDSYSDSDSDVDNAPVSEWETSAVMTEDSFFSDTD